MFKFLIVSIVSFWFIPSSTLSSQDLSRKVRLSHHLPEALLRKAKHIGRKSAGEPVQLTVSLNFQNQAELTTLIEQLYDPKDSHYQKFLSSAEFAQRYYPSDEDVRAVKKYFTDQGLTIGSQVANTIQISGSTQQVENAFNIELHDYAVTDKQGQNSIRFAPLDNPMVDASLAPKILGVTGLSTLASYHSHLHILSRNTQGGIGTGPGGGLSPNDVRTAYSVPTTAKASGQTLALMELDGYKSSDISLYAQQFGFTLPSLQNILVDGATGAAGAGEVEVALDIEIMSALAPGANKILVYEGVNSDSGVVDLYAKIASDNLAQAVSTSWGGAEDQSTSAILNSEKAAFMQMAAQGQSIYAAAGDNGAYDDAATLSVDDPGSQTYVTSAGGTTLALNANGTYQSESSWGVSASTIAQSEGGGGGISSIWPLPTWQTALASTSNKGSTSFRMVPDISANANPETGYAIAVDGAFTVVGGTSCVAPIMAAMTALVNSARAANHVAPLGFANPTLYRLYASSQRSQVFNDVNDGSTNLFYPAVTGYDLSTGLGTISMGNLYLALVNPLLPPLIPGGLAIVSHNTLLSLSWNSVASATSYTLYRGTSSASGFKVLAPNISSLSYNDTGLTNGTTYFYYVVANDSAGASLSSAVVSATPALSPPQPPSNLSVSEVLP